MKAEEIVRTLVENSGISKRQVSLSMGRSESFIGAVIAQSRMPNIELASEIADACGYDTIFRSRETGKEIKVDPPDNLPSQRY